MKDKEFYLDVNFGKTGEKPGELAELIIESLIKRFSPEGTTAVDCGVADGRFLKIFQNKVSKLGTVIGFEPIPESFSNLAVGYSDLENVILKNKCVSSQVKDERISFYWVKDRRWVSSLSPDNLGHYNVEEILVEVTTIDDEFFALPDFRAKPVSFIKLDIEGAEFDAMRGAGKVIDKFKPFIVFENSLSDAAHSFGYDISTFFDFFNNRDYMLFDVFGIPLVPAMWSRVGKDISWNFIAVYAEDERLKDLNLEWDTLLCESYERLIESSNV